MTLLNPFISFPGGGGGSLDFSNTNTFLANNSTGSTAYSETGVGFGAADASRKVLTLACFGLDTAATPFDDITLGGVSATIDVKSESSDRAAAYAYATVASGTTGTVTYDNSVTQGSWRGCGFRTYRVLNESSIGWFGTGFVNTAATPSLTASVLTGDKIVAIAFNRQTIITDVSQAGITWNGVTEVEEGLYRSTQRYCNFAEHTVVSDNASYTVGVTSVDGGNITTVALAVFLIR